MSTLSPSVWRQPGLERSSWTTRGTAAIRADVTARANRLTTRQSAIVAELYTARTISLSSLEPLIPRVTRRSLQRDLKVLLEKGLLREVDSGPTDPNRQSVTAEL